MDNLEEMITSLETYNLPRLNQEEIEKVNKQMASNEIESAILKNFQQTKQKSPRPDNFTGEFYKTFKEELKHIL